jgi:predicted HTH domain antitoxin
MKTVTLNLSDELIKIAKFKSDQISKDALQLIVLELYREEVISLGKAAELGDLSISEFMEFSASRQVPLHYTKEDLNNDRVNITKLKI